MKVIHTIVILGFLSGVTLYAEPSVYGNSHSFISPEKSITKNRKSIAMLTRQLAAQKEQIDGLKSIVEGLSATLHELQQPTQNSGQNDNTENALLHNLSEMIDKINTNYVTKEELQRVMGTKTIVPQREESMAVQSNKPAQAYSEGVRLFVKHRYDEAKKRFKLTDSKGYKTAPSNYYLGEISYYTKKYEDAIFYYKKSAGLNDKASYIDTLLLHTAISLEKRGENDQAKVFYENIVANYEGRKTAQIAKEKLKKL